MIDPDSQSFNRAMQRKLQRFYAGFQPIGITILDDIACLKFSEHHLQPLNRQNAAAMHRKEWDEVYTYLGDSKPE
jgi:hypothetical protein